MLDFFFPRFCFGCGFIGCYLCPTCRAKTQKQNKEECFYCGKKALFGFTHKKCKKKHGIDGYHSIYYYHGATRRLIHQIKYQKAQRAIEESIPSDLSCPFNRWTEMFPNLVLQPVPLHKDRQRKRGFNQAELIAEEIVKKERRVKLLCGLVRVRNTQTQTKMKNNAERTKNIRGAFISFPRVDGQNIVLIDDVKTSGATVIEATKTLKEGGAHRVFVLALAN